MSYLDAIPRGPRKWRWRVNYNVGDDKITDVVVAKTMGEAKTKAKKQASVLGLKIDSFNWLRKIVHGG